MEKTKRALGPDLVRCVAFFAVISVHFLLNSGFYDVQVRGLGMYLAGCAKTVMMTCVPLFLLLTGYLMGGKQLSAGYYGKCTRTLATYVLVSLAMFAVEVAQGRAEWTLDSFLWPLLDFGRPSYGWYVEMYIGLFLLIPFLNTLYDAAGKQRTHLIVTLAVLVTLPAMVSVWHKLLPAWWGDLYPIMYYFIGCWLREHRPRLHKGLNLLLLAVLPFVFGRFEYVVNYGETYNQQPWASYYSLSALTLSVLIFLLLYNVQGKKLPSAMHTGVGLISRLTLGAYLISQLFDDLFYTQLAEQIPEVAQRICPVCFFSVVPKVALCSLAAAGCIELVWIGLEKVGHGLTVSLRKLK